MEFTLFYQGEIKSGNSADITHKNEIRLKMHEQLIALKNLPPLNQHVDILNKFQHPEFFASVGGFDFFHLVSKHFNMYAELDLNILIPTSINFGDIDNKLKTLFDALRPPQNGEIPANWIPTAGQTPLLCLLEDDDLIYKVHVDTDYLLDPTAAASNQLIVVIGVRVKGNSGFISMLDLII